MGEPGVEEVVLKVVVLVIAVVGEIIGLIARFDNFNVKFLQIFAEGQTKDEETMKRVFCSQYTFEICPYYPAVSPLLETLFVICSVIGLVLIIVNVFASCTNVRDATMWKVMSLCIIAGFFSFGCGGLALVRENDGGQGKIIYRSSAVGSFVGSIGQAKTTPMKEVDRWQFVI